MGGSGSPGASGSKGKKSLLEKSPDDVSALPFDGRTRAHRSLWYQ
jgi:hypothetical protein